jgi:hypothetical protein
MKKTRPSNILMRIFVSVLILMAIFVIGAILFHVFQGARESPSRLRKPVQVFSLMTSLKPTCVVVKMDGFAATNLNTYSSLGWICGGKRPASIDKMPMPYLTT